MNKKNSRGSSPVTRERDPLIHVQDAIKFIHKNYSKPITIYEISAHVQLNRSHLYRIFMQYIEVSPKQYLTDYRIKMAYALLQKKPYPADVLSKKVGIKDSDRFSSQFKKVYGKTPTAYVKADRVKKMKSKFAVETKVKKRTVRKGRGK